MSWFPDLNKLIPRIFLVYVVVIAESLSLVIEEL